MMPSVRKVLSDQDWCSILSPLNMLVDRWKQIWQYKSAIWKLSTAKCTFNFFQWLHHCLGGGGLGCRFSHSFLFLANDFQRHCFFRRLSLTFGTLLWPRSFPVAQAEKVEGQVIHKMSLVHVSLVSVAVCQLAGIVLCLATVVGASHRQWLRPLANHHCQHWHFNECVYKSRCLLGQWSSTAAAFCLVFHLTLKTNERINCTRSITGVLYSDHHHHHHQCWMNSRLLFCFCYCCYFFQETKMAAKYKFKIQRRLPFCCLLSLVMQKNRQR